MKVPNFGPIDLPEHFLPRPQTAKDCYAHTFRKCFWFSYWFCKFVPIYQQKQRPFWRPQTAHTSTNL